MSRLIHSPSVCRTLARYLFLAFAVVCFSLFAYAYLERVLYQSYSSWKFNQKVSSRVAIVPPSHGLVSVTSSVTKSVAKSPSTREVIGRLSIARLGLSAMVLEGTDSETLQFAVGHILATPLPWQPGNVGVAGHRDTFFRQMKNLHTGDEIEFSTANGTFNYVVESLSIVEPADVGVLAGDSTNVLTLVTCYPFSYVGAAPRRFIARARQVLKAN